jgi:hypothetical protein
MHSLRVTCAVVALGALPLAPLNAGDVPSFVRQTGMTCAQCHVMFGAPVPNFTFTGKKFRMNGYRVPFVTERIEAGKEGALGGKRLNISLFPYISLRYQSVFATQSKTPGAAQAGPISSNPTSRLAIFTGGPVGDYFGLWTEMYLTPDGSASGEWTLGLFSFDEYDLRYTRMKNNNVFGLAFNNQGIAEVSGFGPWSPGGSQLNRGGVNGWSHPNRGNFLAYAWLNDRLLVTGGASPGENNLDWKKMSYLGQVAYAFFNSDAKEAWVNLMVKAGNDGIPLATTTAPANSRTWAYNNGVCGPTFTPGGTCATGGVPTFVNANGVSQIADFSRVTTELRYAFIDRGPHSMEVGGSFNINTENYLTGDKLKQNSVFGRVRYVNNRTYGVDLTVGKNTTYQYNGADIPNKVSYNSYFTFQPAMNMILALSYGTTQTFRLGATPLTGWNWGLNIDYLF